MGIVSQHPILFNTSFKENIAFGVETADMERVENAATYCKCPRFHNGN